MTQRINIHQHSPNVIRQLIKLANEAAKDLDPTIKELVLMRSSQINRCAYCIDMHTKDARAAGETDQRIALVAAFEEADNFFTEKERAALALAEAITVLTDGFVPDEVYERAAKHFDEKELAQLISTIAVINTFNRLNVTARAEAGSYTPGQFAGQH
ncbi:alkylhydroperoxidase AhpD family core domain-containing protein [Actinopolymorpha cephalotaxi]|uniref:AhpD family alkylhydroperoxidase n=1 Tax=Actinopolymorpha cephalotaxi TaxID=504797 RepID=A0A1I2PEW8_9ACTN|nr:carboxymuconolactone decarboxylase family protein [Actinopolymorpha cephalotaxi]NYH83635.1 AhpD family alkylhydroperoxidase [Actinopolymorpha cephalotaxi]SFG14614.1 alkylhydroperoxidase AhpD family core domain-containing protein [Actinopolymorpha cephalotaxi]